MLEAATRAFAHGGYHGTSTDAVAKEAGVSQPYVVRIFGTKLDLFLEVFERAVGRIKAAFEEVLDGAALRPGERGRQGPDGPRLHRAPARPRLPAGDDARLLERRRAGDRGRRPARAWAAVFATIQRTGWDDEKVRDFVAYGMLLNVMISMRAPENLDARRSR